MKATLLLALLVLAKTIPLPQVRGGFNHHSADGAHHRLFLCASTNKTVEVLDLDTGKIIKSLPGDKPAATCFAPDLNLLCVSRGKTIQLYDAKSFQLLAALPMPASIDELRYDPASKQLLAGCMTAPHYGITPVDLAARKVLPEIKSPQPQGFCLETGGNRIFVCTPRADQITVIDRSKSAVVDAWKLTDAHGDYPAAFDPATHRLFVGCRQPAKLVIFDTDTGKAVANVNIGKGTDDLSFDPANKRIYVACGEGVISVIKQDDADHYRHVGTVTTVPGARNCVFVPETAQFCVTVPERGSQQASVLVYRADADR